MMEELFEVATEFKFDVGQALVSSKNLQSAVDDVSKSANAAVTSLNFLASGLVARLGLGSGGILSLLTKAVQVSEAFNNSALMFSNNISANMQVLQGTIGTFNDRLATSKMLMESIQSTSIKFGLDTSELSRITQLISTPLAMRGKLGNNYGNAISMSKNLLLGSEAAGLHPQVASESLYRALTEHMPLHGALFARLVNTPAFKQGHVGSQHQLMNMNTDKKIDLLGKALEQLAGDADWLNFKMKSIGTQMIILKDQLEVALKPIGDAIVKPIRMVLAHINQYLASHGKDIGENISKFIGSIFESPERLFVNLFQLKRLGGDFRKAVDWAGIIITLTWVKRGLEMIGITFGGGFLRKAFAMIIDGFMYLGRALVLVLPTIVGFLGPILSEFMGVFLPLLFFFQILSRSMAMAHLADIENMLTLTPKVTALFVRIKNALEAIMTPLTMMFDFWAKLLAPLFETSFWLKLAVPIFEGLASVLETVGNATIWAMAQLSGLTMVMIGFVDDIIKRQNPLKNVTANFADGYKDFMASHHMGDMGKAVVNQVTNVGKIEARFDMREQLEPDRIAFAVTTHLKKLAMNPTQGRGQSLGSQFANPVLAGAR